MRMDWLIGLGGSLLIAAAAYKKGSLTRSGAIAAAGVGTILYALGSLVWYGLMIAFFISATLLTRWKHHQKKKVETVYQKTGRRDTGQVMANGGLGVLLCMIHACWPNAQWPLLGYIGVIATVTADTWATEVGGLSSRLPRSIVNWHKVPKGTSGGVSLLGWMAAACGGLFIGGLTLLAGVWDVSAAGWIDGSSAVFLLLVVMLSGWLGTNADSYLGATLQAMYRCTVCGLAVESRAHCGHPSSATRGLSYMDNDAVNLLSSLVGGAISAGLGLWLLP